MITVLELVVIIMIVTPKFPGEKVLPESFPLEGDDDGSREVGIRYKGGTKRYEPVLFAEGSKSVK